MGPNELLHSPNGYLWVLMNGSYASLWIILGPGGYLRFHLLPDGSLLKFEGPNELLHNPDGSSRVLMDSYRSQWILWVLMDYYGS